MLVDSIFRKKVVLAFFSATLSLSAGAVGHSEEEVNYCGHKDHDSQELREQASNRIYWQDYRAANPESWVRFKILGFNDFHGAIEQRNLFGRPAGGAAVLGSYLKSESEESENGAFIVHAGDHVGASPPVSALLQDEPSITFLNMLANESCQYNELEGDDEEEKEIDNNAHTKAEKHKKYKTKDKRFNPKCNLIGTLGNHEFDEGVSEMQRLVNGGIHKNGPFLDDNYRGARFPYVIANVVDEQTNEPILPPYVIKRVDGQKIAFIGVVLKGTPSIVTPTGVAGVKFLDEAEAINSYVAELQAKGVRAIVVTIHQGTSQSTFGGETEPLPVDIGGSIGPIIQQLDDEIDIVVSGHWHRFTNALVSNKNGKLILVTQAFSRSTAYADIDVAIDPATKDIVEKSAEIVTTWADTGPGLKPDPQIAGLVERAVTMVGPLVNRIIGSTVNGISRTENAAGESALGNLIADAQRSAMATEIAFMNAGGIRANLTAGDVTWGELFSIQPLVLAIPGKKIIRLNLPITVLWWLAF
jgi:5'-nucleotidase